MGPVNKALHLKPIDQVRIDSKCFIVHETYCSISVCRFIRLRVRMIPFDSAAHPGSFEVVLSVGRSVLSLMWIIQERVGIQTSQLKVFRSRVSTEEACLSPLSSLEECGFKGGSEICPTEATVYYDYTLPRMDCPILNCDHYFT